MNCANGHSNDPPRQMAIYHFYVGLVLGLVAIVLSALFVGSAPVSALNRIGEDRAQRIYAGGHPESPTHTPVVFIDVAFPRSADVLETDRIAQVIRKLAGYRPKAIVVDQQVNPLDPSSFIEAVKQAASLGIDVVITPSLETVGLSSGKPIPIVPGGTSVFYTNAPAHVILASPLLLSDADGAIRRFEDSDRFTLNGSELSLPTFAGSLVDQHDGSSDGHGTGFPIRYLFSRADLAETPALLITKIGSDGDIQAIDDRVAGKIVLIGESDPSNPNDVHQTPLGPMPGALIHANILLSARNGGLDWGVFLLGIAIYAALGLLALRPWFMLSQTAEPRAGKQFRRPGAGACVLAAALVLALAIPIGLASHGGHLEAAESIKLSMELASVLFASFVFAAQDALATGRSRIAWMPDWLGWLLLFALAVGIVVCGIAIAWFLLGATLLSFGLLVGSLVPVVATCLEALIKAGEHVTKPIHDGLQRLSLRSLAFLAAAYCAGITPAFAADPPPATLPPGRAGLVGRSWSTFVELLTGSPEARSIRVVASGDRVRGSDSIPLQWLPTIPAEGAALPAGAPGLTLVWTGGAEPFLVSLESESGTALGATRTGSRLLHLPDFVMTSEPVFVQVTGKGGRPINATLRPAAAEPPPRAASGQVIAEQLAAAPPNRRLDALRRLSLAARTDGDAAEAIALIKHTAEVPP